MANIPNIQKCDKGPKSLSIINQLIDAFNSLPPSSFNCADLEGCEIITNINTLIEEIQIELGNLPTSYFTCGDLAACQTIIDITESIEQLQTDVQNIETTIDNIVTQLTTIASDLTALTTLVGNHISDQNNPHLVSLEQARLQDNFFNGDVDMNNNRLRNLPVPLNADEAVNKSYVDGLIDKTLKPAQAYNPNITNLFPTTYNGDPIKQGDTFRLQAGTMNGVVVSAEDLLIADVDNPGQTVGNWQILESNREQATESVMGVLKIATQIDVENELTNNNIDAVTPQKFWFGILRFLKLAWTWDLKQTFTTAPRFNSVSASQYLKVDGTKDLTSVSSIPATDITQTTNRNFQTDNQNTFNDLTSSGQTQLDSKLPIQVPQTSGVALTFVTDSVYGTIASPETGNITYSATNAKLGVTNLIIHNHSSAPTFGTNMKKLSGSGLYTINVVNYIFVQYINSTEVIYSINQRT